MLYKTKSILIEATPIAGKMVILSEKDFLRICEPADDNAALSQLARSPLPRIKRKRKENVAEKIARSPEARAEKEATDLTCSVTIKRDEDRPADHEARLAFPGGLQR